MKNKKTEWILRIIAAVLFFTAFFAIEQKFGKIFSDWKSTLVQLCEIILVFGGVFSLIPGKKNKSIEEAEIKNKKGFLKKNFVPMLVFVILIPATVLFGLYHLQDRKYYFISVLVMIEAAVPLIIAFERKKGSARELVLISVLAGLAVAGRVAFSVVPQFKPMAAVIIIAGVAFGGNVGFFVGTVSAFISNFYFGQGAWTPWQMLGFGIVGLVSGILTEIGFLRKNQIILTLFGFSLITLIYGILMNISSVLMYQENPNMQMILASCLMGIPYDLVHGASTAFFMYFMGIPILEKLERVKNKYGLSE